MTSDRHFGSLCEGSSEHKKAKLPPLLRAHPLPTSFKSNLSHPTSHASGRVFDDPAVRAAAF